MRVARWVALLAVTTLAPGVLTAPAVAAEVSIEVSQSVALPGEKVTVRGTLPSPSRQTLALQRRDGDGWTTLRTTRTPGPFAFGATITSAVTFRVARPADSTTTDAVNVRLATQRTRIRGPVVARQGTPSTWTGISSPAREGRKMSLQAVVDGGWVTVATSAADEDGVASLTWTPTTPGPTRLRVVAGRFAGGASATSGAREVAVKDRHAPHVVALSPDEGSIDGGESVTLTGTDLAGTTAVRFGDAEATVTEVGPTSVTVTTPTVPDDGVTEVVVTTALGTSEPVAFTYLDYRDVDADGLPPGAKDERDGQWVELTGALPDGLVLDPAHAGYLVRAASVPRGRTVTIPAGVRIKCGDWTACLTVEGRLDVEGTLTRPVVVTSARDHLVGGRAVAGAQATEQDLTVRAFDVRGGGVVDATHVFGRFAETFLHVRGGSAATLADSTVRQSSTVVLGEPGSAATVLRSDLAGFHGTREGSLTIRDSVLRDGTTTVRDAAALTVEGSRLEPSATLSLIRTPGTAPGSAPTIRRNSVLNDDRRFSVVVSGLTADLAGNWWGRSAGPTANHVDGSATISPWCLDEGCSALSG